MERHHDHSYARILFWFAIATIAAGFALKAVAQEQKPAPAAQQEKGITLKPEDANFFRYLKTAEEGADKDQLKDENERIQAVCRDQVTALRKQLIAVVRDARLWKLRAENNCIECDLDESGTTLRKPVKK